MQIYVETWQKLTLTHSELLLRAPACFLFLKQKTETEMYMFKTDTETSSDDTKSVFADGEAVLLS